MNDITAGGASMGMMSALSKFEMPAPVV